MPPYYYHRDRSSRLHFILRAPNLWWICSANWSPLHTVCRPTHCNRLLPSVNSKDRSWTGDETLHQDLRSLGAATCADFVTRWSPCHATLVHSNIRLDSIGIVSRTPLDCSEVPRWNPETLESGRRTLYQHCTVWL